MRNETVNVLQYIAQNKETEEIVASMLNDVLQREDILSNLTELIIQGNEATLVSD